MSRSWGRGLLLLIAVLIFLGIVLLKRGCVSTPVSGEAVAVEVSAKRARGRTSSGRSSPIASPTGPHEEELHSDGTELRVLDLWDGSPVAGVGIRVQGKKDTAVEVCVTDELGRIRIPSGDLLVLTPDGGEWRGLAARTIAECVASGKLWVMRQISVEVSVALIGADVTPPSAEQIRLEAVPGGSLGTPLDPETPEPWSVDWLRAAGLGRSVLQASFTADGKSVVMLPRCRGMCVHASANGWRPAFVRLPDDLPRDGARVRLALQRAAYVSGVVRSTDGVPLLNTRVVVYTTRRLPVEAFSDEALHVEFGDRGGFSASYSPTRGGYVTVVSSVLTDAAGRFRVELRSAGEVLVVGYPPSHHRVVARMQEPAGDVEGLGLDAIPSPVDVMRITIDGRALSDSPILVADMTYDPEQPAIDARTSVDGTIETGWFERGSLYSVIPLASTLPPHQRRAHFFTFTGQSDIDLGALPTKRPK